MISPNREANRLHSKPLNCSSVQKSDAGCRSPAETSGETASATRSLAVSYFPLPDPHVLDSTNDFHRFVPKNGQIKPNCPSRRTFASLAAAAWVKFFR